MTEQATDTATSTDEAISRFAAIETERRDIEDRLKILKEERGHLEEQLKDHFIHTGIQKVTINGLTIYLHRQIWATAKDGDKARAAAALRSAGLVEYVTEGFNTNSVSAFVREQEAIGQDLPDEIADAFNVAEVFQIRSRK